MKEGVTLFGVKSPIGEVQLKRTQPWGRGHFHESQWEGVTQDCWLTLREKSEQRPKLGDPQTPLRSAPSFPSPENQSRAPTCTLQGRGLGRPSSLFPLGSLWSTESGPGRSHLSCLSLWVSPKEVHRVHPGASPLSWTRKQSFQVGFSPFPFSSAGPVLGDKGPTFWAN